MAGPETRLRELGIDLPGLQPALGNYLPAKRWGELVFVSGQARRCSIVSLSPSGRRLRSNTGSARSKAMLWPWAILLGLVAVSFVIGWLIYGEHGSQRGPDKFA
jgi:hypothetical protein